MIDKYETPQPLGVQHLILKAMLLPVLTRQFERAPQTENNINWDSSRLNFNSDNFKEWRLVLVESPLINENENMNTLRITLMTPHVCYKKKRH